MGVIQRLPPEVVNRMAAGEVVARPNNAIKELVENCLDAGATEVVVNLQNSGLKLLQVTDNGKGIARDDFDLLCERFATSKLQKFEDLMHMKTYGFRGEALASLSHVSKVNIVSKQPDSTCAYQSNFLDGKMQAPTKPSAGKNGTCVTATDLFYNLPQRKNKMQSHSEESRLVFDTLMRFAIHRPDVAFALRQNHSSDFRTKGDGNFRDVVSTLVGRDIADNIVNMNYESTRLKFQFSGCMSKPIPSATAKTAQNKKLRQSFFSVFINGRSVKCDVLKQPVDDVMSTRSLITQFCAMDLKIDETRVDVNVHPTKNSVLFLERDEIIDEIKNFIEKTVNEMFGLTDNSTLKKEPVEEESNPRSFLIHQVKSIEAVRRSTTNSGSPVLKLNRSFSSQNNGKEKKRVDYMEVRTDSKERKLDEFIIRCNDPKKKSNATNENREFLDDIENLEIEGSQESTSSRSHEASNQMEVLDEVSMVTVTSCCEKNDTLEANESVDLNEVEGTTRREFDFESLKELRNDICEGTSMTLREMFKTFTFVGSIDVENVLIQFGTSLYQLNLSIILKEFFYQTTVFSFGNFGSYRIDENPPSVNDLLELLASMDTDEEGINNKKYALFDDINRRRDAENLLFEHADLLNDYFAIKLEWVEEDQENRWLRVVSIPSLIHYYVPQLEKLPFLFGALVLDVDYDDEKKCFEGICRAIADFFALDKDFVDSDNVSAFSNFSWKVLIHQILMPLVKKKFLPPENLKANKAIRQLADAHDLYKVFERCGT